MTLCDIHGQPYPPEVEARMLAPEPGEGAEETGDTPETPEAPAPETPEAPVADVSVTTPGEEPKKLEE